MSTLRTGVTKGFEALGLAVEGDKTALTVTDGVDGQRLVVRVDENERVVRVEGVICYPVDDFPAELSRAMDWLNRARGGVCFSYDSSQRALVVATAWTSPNREPAPNQLHLLVALVQEACGRDGPQLERVAEGEAGWQVVAEGAEAEAPAPAAPARATGRGSRFGDRLDDLPTRNLDELEDPATRPMPAAEAGPRVTTKFMGSADGEDFDLSPVPGPAPTPPGGVSRTTGKATRRFEELEAAAEAGASAAAEDETIDEPGPAAAGSDTKHRLKRSALQMAVHRAEHDKGQRVDLTRGRRNPVLRVLRGLIILAALLGAGYGVVVFFVEPFFPGITTLGYWRRLAGLDAPEADPRIAARAVLPPRELLLAELTDPLPDEELHKAGLRRALEGLGDAAAATLEQLVLDSPSGEVRAKAYTLWADGGHAKGDAGRLRLLRGLMTLDRKVDDPVDTSFKFLLVSIRANPPSDAALGEALAWAKGSIFVLLVELLGRPGDGAEARSKALAPYLEKDTPDLAVLRAMVATGFGPPDAAARLVVGKGLEWARGDEGKAILTGFVQANPDSCAPLLKHQDEELRLMGVDLLVAAATPQAVDRLGRGLRDPASRVRVRAARGLGTLGLADAAWPLASAMAQRETAGDQDFQDECRRALGKLPATDAVTRLKEHCAPTLPVSERYYATAALGLVSNAGGVPALIEVLKDPDAQVRRKALEVCEALAGSNRTVLGQGTAALREVALRDPDASVRQAAGRLYQMLTGAAPR